jgi:hypothetical protein
MLIVPSTLGQHNVSSPITTSSPSRLYTYQQSSHIVRATLILQHRDEDDQ